MSWQQAFAVTPFCLLRHLWSICRHSQAAQGSWAKPAFCSSCLTRPQDW